MLTTNRRLTMKYIRHIAAYVSALTLAVPGVFASEAPSVIEFVRPLGMGGAFTAVADDQNIFNYNPAGLVQRTGAAITLLEIAGGISEDTIKASDFVDDNKEQLDNWDDLSDEEQTELQRKIATEAARLRPRVYVAADIASYVSGPRFLGMPIHAGFGVLGVVDSSFQLNPGITVPTVSYNANSDLIIPLSLAHRFNMPFRLPGRIGIGATAKAIRRFQVKRDRVSILELEEFEAPPVSEGRGLGADVGLLYQPTTRINVGVMFQDIGGTKIHFDEVESENNYPALPERDGIIKTRTNVGVAIVPKTLLWLIPTGERWTFAADVKDIQNETEHVVFENGFKKVIGENFYAHLYMGAEFRYWFLRFRGGASQGYPTLGLGLDIPFIKVDVAWYSRELGVKAGDQREENLIASLAFRFGSGATESRERINNAKETQKQNEMATPDNEPVSTPATEPSKTEKPAEGTAAPASDALPQ
jgi:hypothetical protein